MEFITFETFLIFAVPLTEQSQTRINSFLVKYMKRSKVGLISVLPPNLRFNINYATISCKLLQIK